MSSLAPWDKKALEELQRQMGMQGVQRNEYARQAQVMQQQQLSRAGLYGDMERYYGQQEYRPAERPVTPKPANNPLLLLLEKS